MDHDAARYLGQYGNPFNTAKAAIKPAPREEASSQVVGEEYLRNLMRQEAEKLLHSIIPQIVQAVKDRIEENLHETFSQVRGQIGEIGTEQAKMKVLVTQVQRQVFGGKNMPIFKLEIN